MTGTSTGEFRVNSYTNFEQEYPAIASLDDGGFVVVWSSYKQDGTDLNIWGQRYDASGTPVGTEFRVNSTVANTQHLAVVTALHDGGFVVSWMSNGQDGSGWGVYAQRYDASGSAVGGEFRVNTTVALDQREPEITTLADGGFVISWVSNDSANSKNVYAQRYDAFGTAIGGQFQVGASGAGDHHSITALGDGGFAVAWQSFGPAWQISVQRYDAAGGRAGTEQVVSVSDPASLAKSNPSITALNDGGFVVTWTSYQQDGDNYGIYAQRFDSTGSALGGEFRVNTITAGPQTNPTALALSDGGFIISWDSFQQATGYDIHAQRYDAAGAPVGSEFLINEYTTGSQSNSVLAARDDGSFIASWMSNGQDGSDMGVYARIFAPIPPVTITSGGGGDEATVLIDEREIIATQITAESQGSSESMHYAIVGGDDASLFRIDPDTGLLGFATAPDFEAPASADGDNSYQVRVQADNGLSRDTQLITVEVQNINERPVITSDGGGTTASLSVSENGTFVTTVVGADPDGDTIWYRIQPDSNDSALFTINGETGVLSFVTPPDYEAPSDFAGDNFYRVTVEVTDGTPGWSAFQTIEILVTDVNEAPTITSNGGGDQASISIAENGTAVTSVTASDPDGGAPSYSIAGGADAGLFSIDAATGALGFIVGPDREAPADFDHDNVYDVIVRVSDGMLNDDQALAVTVTNVNEAPVLTDQQASLPNGTEDVSYVVSAAQLLAGFTDVDGDALSVANLSASSGSIVDNGNGSYTIIQGANFNGAVTLSYNVVDGNGSSTSSQLAYTVNAVNDAPTGSVTISGTAATGFQLIASNTISDDDGVGTVSYQWLQDGQAIAGATGASYVVRPADLGHLISVAASYTDPGGTPERVTSAATDAIAQGPGTFSGTTGADTIAGGAFDDILIGLAGNDVLRGFAGNDVLNGGAGNDTLDGGAGIDTASYSDATAGVKVSLAVTNSQNTGGSGSDTLLNIENLLGSGYGDTLTGNAGANRLNGGADGDTLTGGAGADTFVFDILTTSANKDTVKDFVSGTDRIELSSSAFSALTGYGLGQLDANELAFGTKATLASQHLLYDPKTGALIYDPDGSGAAAAVTIAVLSGHPTLLASDIFLS